jgi:hypothetical protein
MNATGQYQVATIANGTVYNTRTYGSSWSAISSVGTANWSSSAVSTTGQYQVVCASGGNIWLSNNFGSSWSQVTGLANQVTPSLPWNGLAVTSNGQYMLATVYNSRIYYSINYGQTWNQSSSDLQPWSSISVSSTGQFANATSLTGAIYNMTLGFPGTLPASANSSTVTGALTAGSISTGQATVTGALSSGSISTGQATVTGALSSGSLTVNSGDSTLNAITAKSGSTGLVGINNSTPAYQLDINSPNNYAVNISQSVINNSCLRMTNPNNTINTTMFSPYLTVGAFNSIAKANDVGFFWGNSAGSATGGFIIAPWANATSGLRIDSGGGIDMPGEITSNTSTRFIGGMKGIRPNGTTSNTMWYYWNGSQFVFNVDTNTSYSVGANSDYRIKHNFREPQNILNRICDLKLFDYQFKDISNIKNDGIHRLGIFAHELQEIFPEYKGLVNGEKDGVNEKGEIVVQSIAGETIQYLLMKSIQEQNYIVKTLEKRINELEKRLL